MGRAALALVVALGLLGASSPASAAPLDPAQVCTVVVRSVSDLTISDSTLTQVVYDTEDVDDCGMFDAGVDDGVLVAPFDGACVAGYYVNWQASGTGNRRAGIRLGASGLMKAMDSVPAVTGDLTHMAGSALMPVQDGDELWMVVRHTHGSNLELVGGTSGGTYGGQYTTLWAVCYAQGSAVGGGSFDDTTIVAGLYQLSQQVQGASGFAATVAWLFVALLAVLVVFSFARVR